MQDQLEFFAGRRCEHERVRGGQVFGQLWKRSPPPDVVCGRWIGQAVEPRVDDDEGALGRPRFRRAVTLHAGNRFTLQ